MLQKNILQVTCALIFQNNMLLAAQRSEKTSLPLKWELPGGKTETGETAEDCIRRELKEELGIQFQITQRLNAYRHICSDGSIIELTPFVGYFSGTIQLFEHRQIKWIIPSEYRSVDWAEADLNIIKNFIQQQQSQQ